ncbi:MAG: aspartate-semialdehyde dehydrogenase [Clostridium sp.]|jgi:aspartate-semialdehyde dehydrogenase|nr:aspartate-semialdehyde dehydrogenase [Clostridium sp.]MDD7139525.1 aspartate-semialdehyde dehydrogenase [Clostridium sp.]MDY6081159.1 aspartate-semialdehyde dehydrogenase [Eubacteriales bacterium]
MKQYRVAVVGATGMVGRKFLQVLEERKLPVSEYFLFASARSAGKQLPFMGKTYTVRELTDDAFQDLGIDIALFSAGGETSRHFAPIVAASGAVVIDNSSCWRMDPDVPLVVPEVNPDAIPGYKNKGIIANPNCSTIQAMVVLKPLADAYGLKRVVYSTYQAVSGAGQKGYMDLVNGLKGEAPQKFPHPIAGNCLPHIDVFLDTGYTKEEQKMIDETRKILSLPELRVTATTVRVPVYHGHSESINVEFARPFELDELRAVLEKAPGLIVRDDPKHNVYPMAIEAADTDPVYVGRIRRDFSVDSGVNLWCVADNIRKGAATNAVQIAEELIRQWEA